MLTQYRRDSGCPSYRSLRKEAPPMARRYAFTVFNENGMLNGNLLNCTGMMDADEKYFKEHGEPLFSSHMIDLSEEEVDWNIQTTANYLKRAAPMKQWLEMVGEQTVQDGRL